MSRISQHITLCLAAFFLLTGITAAEDGGRGGKGGDDGPSSNPPSITGAVEKLPASGMIGVWTVAGHTVTVTGATTIVQTSGPAALGSCVKVFGAAQVYYGTSNTDLNAVEIDVISAAGGCATAPLNQNAEIEFFGVISKVPVSPALPGDWTIASRLVHSTITTRLDLTNSTAVGSCAEVKGIVLANGSVQASRIKVDSDKSTCAAGVANTPSMRFVGAVTGLPSSLTLLGTWTVSGHAVVVGASTEIEPEHGAVATGSCVSVRGTVQADSSILATSIETEEASECNAAAGTTGQFDVEGIVVSTPASGNIGDWQIGTRTVRVGATTAIDTSHGTLAVGSCVEARGTLAADGVLTATFLESLSSSGACLLHDGIVSAASFTGGAVAPGQVISIFGLNIGTPATHEFEIEGDHIKNTLSSVQVFFDGIPAALLLVSPGQINAVVPFEVAGKTSAQVQVQNNGVWSNVVTIPISASAPSIFTKTEDGKGQGAVLNFDSDHSQFTLNAPSNGAKKGSVMVMFLTGTGLGNSPQSDGKLAGSQLVNVQQNVKVTFGSKDGQVMYAGSAPGLVAGVSQINVRVPDDSPDGDSVPVIVTVGDRRSQDGVTVAIR